MVNKRFCLAILAIALVFGMALLGACRSSPKAYSVIEQVMPDAQSAVVYFSGTSTTKAVLWDGETPIGDFDEGPMISHMPWKTTPGEHYFMANATNWIVMKADLKPNTRYFVNIWSVPSGIGHFIAMRALSQEDGETWLKQGKILSFTDEWRAEFVQDKRGKRLQEAKEQLQKAKNDKSMEITLK